MKTPTVFGGGGCCGVSWGGCVFGGSWFGFFMRGEYVNTGVCQRNVLASTSTNNKGSGEEVENSPRTVRFAYFTSGGSS